VILLTASLSDLQSGKYGRGRKLVKPVSKSAVFGKLNSLLSALQFPNAFQMRKQGILWKLFIQLDMPWFRTSDFRTIFDIGANAGSWSRTLHMLFPRASIYAFEPLKEHYDTLVSISGDIPELHPFNVALGDQNGLVSFYKNEFSPSSSIHLIDPAHLQAFPYASKAEHIEVPVRRLDDIIHSENIDIEKDILIKIDVQGHENEVLKGSKELLAYAKLLIIETSFVRLYEGQPLFNDIYAALLEFGFTYCGSLDQISSPVDGRILQQDSIFIHNCDKS
jgi:FkbM family methyltransferase